MRGLFVLGRLIFGGFFTWSGLNHFVAQREMSGYADIHGVPAPAMAVPVSGALLLAGGVSVLTGIKPREGLAAIIGFLVPVSLQMHRFWEIEDPERRAQEMTQFMKNMALVGAALMLMQVEEPWPASVDAIRQQDEEMYIRIGDRDLRSLPV
jgi:putative oxidoreductase